MICIWIQKALSVEGESICRSISCFTLHLFLFFWAVGTACPITGVWRVQTVVGKSQTGGNRWFEMGSRDLLKVTLWCVLCTSGIFMSSGDWRVFLHHLQEWGMSSESLAVSVLAAKMLWLFGQLLFSHGSTFQSDGKNTSDPWKQQWMSSTGSKTLQESQGTLISHHSTPFHFLLFKIYQTSRLPRLEIHLCFAADNHRTGHNNNKIPRKSPCGNK